MPVFNVESYLKRSFESILNQSFGFENLEVIFVDDASTDSSAEIIKGFVDEYKNVKYFRLDENSGASGKPRNLGIEKASADYLMFLDPDDEFMPDACEILYSAINNSDFDLVSGGYLEDNGNDLIKNDWELLNLKDGEVKVNSIKENCNLLRVPPSVWAKIFRKTFINENKITFPVGVPAQDLYFVSNCLIKAKGILFVDKPIVKYIPRQDGESITSKRDKKTLSAFIKVYNDLYCLLKDFDEDLAWIAAVNLYFWTKIFIASDLNTKDKVDLLKYAHPLFMEFKLSPNLHYKKYHESFFERICDENYHEAIKLATKLSKVNNNEMEFEPHDIFMIFFGFDLKIGGLAKAVFNRANELSKRGYKVTLLNIDSFKNDNIYDDFKNFKYIESYFKKENFLNDSVRLINMFDYFSSKNTLENSKKLVSDECKEINEIFDGNLFNFDFELDDPHFIYKDYIVERKLTEDFQVILRYYNKDDVKNFVTSMYNVEDLIFLKELSLNKNITPTKSEIYIDETLKVKTDLEKKKADLFTNDGFNYCSITQNGNDLQFILKDRESLCTNKFNYKEFYQYFALLMCLESKRKPFLINDCPGPRPSISNISQKLAYKIANIHCNHHQYPFNYGSNIKELGAFENRDELDSIVVLTNTQKNDLKKEIGFNEIYDISNFIPQKEFDETNNEKVVLNPNKISVFARISPEKKLSDIIQSFKKVVEVKENAILEIYGRIQINLEIKEYNRLNKLVKELELENNVKFMGHVDNVNEKMADSIATLFVSEAEGQGLVVIESMMNRTPVISYDLNYGPRDIITDNEDGFIVNQEDIDGLAEKIIELLENPDKAKEMGNLARQKIIDKFSAKIAVDKWEELFKHILINREVNEKPQTVNYSPIIYNDFNTSTLEYIKLYKRYNTLVNDSRGTKIQLGKLEELHTKNKQKNDKLKYIRKMKSILHKIKLI